MIKGPFVTACVAGVAMIAVVVTFMSNASQYVTVAQAKSSSADRLHLAGDILKETVKNDVANHMLSFKVRDASGDIVTVDHTGDVPANMSEANKVVAIGKMKGDHFVSEQLLVKCPSKYEQQDKGQRS